MPSYKSPISPHLMSFHHPLCSMVGEDSSTFQFIPSSSLLKPIFKVWKSDEPQNQLNLTICLLDNEAEPYLISEAILHPKWVPQIGNHFPLHLHCVTKQPIDLLETILLHDQLSKLPICLWLGIIHNLAVSILFGTLVIYSYIRGIFTGKSKIIPWHFTPAQLLQEQSNMHPTSWFSSPSSHVQHARSKWPNNLAFHVILKPRFW